MQNAPGHFINLNTTIRTLALMSETFSAIELKKLYWHSRRGMLELDLILLPFARDAVPALGSSDQHCFRDLLTHEDQDLYNWLIGRHQAPTPALAAMVEQIRQFQTGKGSGAS